MASITPSYVVKYIHVRQVDTKLPISMPAVEQVLNSHASMGYRLHTLETKIMAGGAVLVIMVFEK